MGLPVEICFKEEPFMKLTRLTALVLALVMALSLLTVAQAEEKPSTWISDELVETIIA